MTSAARTFVLLAFAALVAGCATAPSGLGYRPPDQPEAATGYRAKPGWTTHRFAVAAA